MRRLISSAFLLSFVLAAAALGREGTFVHEVIDVARAAPPDSIDGDPGPPIPVAIWTPVDDDSTDRQQLARAPLFLFSHGFGGSGGSYRYLAEHAARAGWIVAAPDHADPVSVRRLREDAETDSVLALVRAAKALVEEEFDFEEYRYRLDETARVLDALLAHERLGPQIDPERIATGGHSFGGYTTLSLAGAVEGRLDPRLRAVVLLSPGLFMFEADDFARVEVPTLYMLGEHELADARGPGTKLDLSRVATAAFSAPTHLLVLEGGRHKSFNDRSRRAAGRRGRRAEADLDAIARVVLAFLEERVGGGDTIGTTDVAAETGRFEVLTVAEDDPDEG